MTRRRGLLVAFGLGMVMAGPALAATQQDRTGAAIESAAGGALSPQPANTAGTTPPTASALIQLAQAPPPPPPEPKQSSSPTTPPPPAPEPGQSSSPGGPPPPPPESNEPSSPTTPAPPPPEPGQSSSSPSSKGWNAIAASLYRVQGRAHVAIGYSGTQPTEDEAKDAAIQGTLVPFKPHQNNTLVFELFPQLQCLLVTLVTLVMKTTSRATALPIQRVLKSEHIFTQWCKILIKAGEKFGKTMSA